MALKNLESWLDRTIGKPARKALEQVAHAFFGALAALVVTSPIYLVAEFEPFGLTATFSWPFALAGLMAAIVGGAAREIDQNIGDEPDGETLFLIGALPVNMNMLLDMLFYAVGGAVVSGIFLALALVE